MRVEEGDSLTLVGYDENDEFKIGEIVCERTGATVMLRDASGRPGWSGGGRRAAP
jgi:predicted deacetylase